MRKQKQQQHSLIEGAMDTQRERLKKDQQWKSLSLEKIKDEYDDKKIIVKDTR